MISQPTVDLEIYDLELWAHDWAAKYEEWWQALPDKENWVSAACVPTRRHYSKILQKIDPEKTKHLLLFFEEEGTSLTEEERLIDGRYQMLSMWLARAEGEALVSISWPASMLRSMQQSPDAYDRLQEVVQSLGVPISHTKSKKGRRWWAHTF
jgi:hypothetical protein